MMKEKLLLNKNLLEKQLFWIKISFDECSKIGIKEKYSMEDFGKFETLCSRYSRGMDFLIRKIFRILDEYEFENQGTFAKSTLWAIPAFPYTSLLFLDLTKARTTKECLV